MGEAKRPDARGWAALAVVYVVWGSTYLAIRVGVRHLPPLAMAGIRYLVAGLLLYPITVRSGAATLRRGDPPRWRQWGAATVVGVLLLAVGNGGVSIGEQTLGSGFAALLAATVPLWMVALSWPIGGHRPGWRAVIGLALGLVGVGVLAGGGSASGQLSGIVVILCAAAAWGLGSVLSHRLPLPRRSLLAAAMEMLAGSSVLLVASLVHGDFSGIRLSQVPASGWLALGYLIGPGSILAFTAYGYALSRLPVSTVSTYAYVNPVVAVLLGAVLLGEKISGHEILGTVFVVGSVALALHRPAGAASSDEPDDEADPKIAPDASRV